MLYRPRRREVDPAQEKCPRCLEPLLPRTSQCPGCGQPLNPGLMTLVPLMIGAACLLLAGLMAVVLYRGAHPTAAPPPVTQEEPVEPFGLPPETSAGHISTPPGKKETSPQSSPEPEKKPPLDR